MTTCWSLSPGNTPSLARGIHEMSANPAIKTLLLPPHPSLNQCWYTVLYSTQRKVHLEVTFVKSNRRAVKSYERYDSIHGRGWLYIWQFSTFITYEKRPLCVFEPHSGPVPCLGPRTTRNWGCWAASKLKGPQGASYRTVIGNFAYFCEK